MICKVVLKENMKASYLQQVAKGMKSDRQEGSRRREKHIIWFYLGNLNHFFSILHRHKFSLEIFHLQTKLVT